jgi:hypothetical protein
MKPLLVWFIVLCCMPAARTRAGEMKSEYHAFISAVIGQHFTGEHDSPALFPMLEFRAGYRVDSWFTTRIDLGLGLTKISKPDRESFRGAGLMASHLSLAFLFTPRLSPRLGMYLGGTTGIWFTAMWGDDLLDTTYGSVQDYLEGTSLSLGGMLGFGLRIAPRWELLFEARYNRAMVQFGGQWYNSGGVGLFFGFVYLVPVAGNIAGVGHD